METQVTLSLY